MSVYVDELIPSLRTRTWPYLQACHLTADTEAQLRGFAKRLGLKRIWFQNNTIPHYDLTRNKRQQAIRMGAIEIDRKQMAERIRKHRKRRTNDQTQNTQLD